MGAKCDREAVGAGRKQAVLMETLPASDIVAIERHNLFVALGALGLFLLTVLGHQFFFSRWRPTSELGLAVRERLRLLSLPLLLLVPLWWATVQVSGLFFLSAELFLAAGYFAALSVVESLRYGLASRYLRKSWTFAVFVHSLLLGFFLFSIADVELSAGAGVYAVGTVLVVFLSLHLVYLYLFKWAQFYHPLASVLRRRLANWAYLGVVLSTCYFAALQPQVSQVPKAWAGVFAGLLALLLGLMVCEAGIASVFDFYFPVVRRAEIPTFFRDLVRGLVFIGLFLGFVGLVLKRDLNSLLVGSAVITVAIGFALQETLGNFFAGLALRLSRPYALGDNVLVGQVSGRVDKIDWRQTSILTFSGDHVNLPNSLVAKEGITNFSSPTRLHARDIRVGVHYRHPPNRVIEVILAVLAEVEEVEREPEPDVHILDFQDSQILFRIRIWIGDYSRRYHIETMVRSGLWYAFRREKIEMPFPTRTLVQSSKAQDYVYGHEADPQVLPFLSDVDFLRALGTESLELLAQRARFRLYAAGERICRQGDSGDSFYIIRSGRLCVEVSDGDGNVFLRKDMVVGNYFGEMALLTGEPRSATVFAVTDAELLMVDKEGLRDVLTANPELEQVVSKALAHRQLRTEKAREEAEGVKGVKDDGSVEHSGRLEQLSEQLLKRIQAFFSY